MVPFEEEEEGTGIASHVVEVEGAESGHTRSPDLRNDTGTAISPISGQQKQSNTLYESAVTLLAYKNEARKHLVLECACELQGSRVCLCTLHVLSITFVT